MHIGFSFFTFSKLCQVYWFSSQQINQGIFKINRFNCFKMWIIVPFFKDFILNRIIFITAWTTAKLMLVIIFFIILFPENNRKSSGIWSIDRKTMWNHIQVRWTHSCRTGKENGDQKTHQETILCRVSVLYVWFLVIACLFFLNFLLYL